MQVERVKYVIWAADIDRAVRFYTQLFGATVGRSNPAITELELLGSVISIHTGGEGKRTWTGLSFQVADVVAGGAEVVAAGGLLSHEPKEENGEPRREGAQIAVSQGTRIQPMRSETCSPGDAGKTTVLFPFRKTRW